MTTAAAISALTYMPLGLFYVRENKFLSFFVLTFLLYIVRTHPKRYIIYFFKMQILTLLSKHIHISTQ